MATYTVNAFSYGHYSSIGDNHANGDTTAGNDGIGRSWDLGVPADLRRLGGVLGIRPIRRSWHHNEPYVDAAPVLVGIPRPIRSSLVVPRSGILDSVYS